MAKAEKNHPSILVVAYLFTEALIVVGFTARSAEIGLRTLNVTIVVSESMQDHLP